MAEGSERDVAKSTSCVVSVDNDNVRLKGYLLYTLLVNWYTSVAGTDTSSGA